MFLRTTAALVLTVFVTASYAQNIPPKRAVDSALVKSISPSTMDEFYSKYRAAKRRNAPRIILVPGVLGSKIEECRTDNSQCTTIWGTVGALLSKDVDLNQKSNRTYRTDVVESLFFKNIYGETLNHIRDRAELLNTDTREDPLVNVFHYDWRESNASNASRLGTRICDVRLKAPNSPIIIIAHSMGGMMTKVWSKRHSHTACSNGAKPDVTRIVFVATPHLGSPKTVKAISQGYNLLFDEIEIVSNRYLRWWEKNYLLDAINRAGASFASVYELLPIRSSEYCQATKLSLVSAAIPAVSDDGKPINIFNPDIWRQYDLLSRIGGSVEGRQPYYDKVALLLKQSEELLCEIVDHDPSTVADVVYLVGRQKSDNTFGWFHLKRGAKDTFEVFTNVEGDGTVPLYSAKSFLVSQTKQTIEVQADHISIIGHPTLLTMIDKWYEEAEARAKLELAKMDNPEFVSLLVAETAASGDLFPVSLNARTWTNDENQIATKINSRALAAMGYSSTDVAQYASLNNDPLDRAKLYMVAASTTEAPDEKWMWVADAAQFAYISSYYDAAIANSELFIEASKSGLHGVPNATELEKRAGKLIGWSYLRNGNRAKFNITANEFAKKYSVAETEFKEPTVMLSAPELFGFPDPAGKKWLEYYSVGPKNLNSRIPLPDQQ